MQLINNTSAGFDKFEQAYNNSNKLAFESAKKIILENQRKISILLGKK